MSFDLDSAIKDWRRKLHKYSGLEPGDLEELEVHLRDAIDDQLDEYASLEDAFLEISQKHFAKVGNISKEYQRARTSPSGSSLNPFQMLPLNLKIAFRNLFRNQTDSLRNLVGLTLSFLAGILIYQYVIFETSYDQFFEDHDRIHRVSAQSFNLSDGSLRGKYAATFFAVAPAIKRDIPEIEASTRLYTANGILRQGMDYFREDDFYYTESDFFEVFKYPLLRGDPSDLDQPNVIFVSTQVAEKYFGTDDPIGQKFEFNTGRFGYDLEVRGVYQDLPENSHLKLNGLISMVSFEHGINSNNIYGTRSLEDVGWRLSAVHQYVLLRKGVDATSLQPKLDDFIQRYRGTIDAGRGVKNEFFLEQVSTVHLSEELNWEMGPKGDRNIVFFLQIIFVVILALGWINYVNLSTAKSITRAKEVGVRKVVGSSKNQLIVKFVTESLLVNLISLVLAIMLTLLLMPYYHELVGKEVFNYFFGGLSSWLYFLLIVMAGIIGSSLYPALVLSSFRPVAILKGKYKASQSGMLFRKSLVSVQFTITLMMLIGIYVLYEQVRFMRNHDIGVSIDETLVLRAPSRNDSITNSQLRVFKDMLSSESGISEVTISSSVPGNEISFRTGARNLDAVNKRQDLFITRAFTHDDFVKFYDLKVVAGRVFSSTRPADQYAVILNREAVKLFGFDSPEDALNGRIAFVMGDTVEVIGVVENFAQRGLQFAYEPLGLQMSRDGSGGFISVKISTENAVKKLEHLKETYAQFFPEDPFEYFFLDERYNRQYQSEEKHGRILSIFTVIAIVIASLGLLGLTSFMVRLRIKEVAIRKVLGASVNQIFGILTKEYLYLIAAACLVGLPITYYGASQWLDTFAFKIDLSIYLFLLPIVVVVFLTFVTIGNLSLKAATSNPVESLKYE